MLSKGPALVYGKKRSSGTMDYVYIIECKLHYKIGLSDDPDRRLRELQTGCPFPLTIRYRLGFECRKEAAFVEKWLHQKLSGQRGIGEWFSYGGKAYKLEKRIRQMLDRHGCPYLTLYNFNCAVDAAEAERLEAKELRRKRAAAQIETKGRRIARQQASQHI